MASHKGSNLVFLLTGCLVFISCLPSTSSQTINKQAFDVEISHLPDTCQQVYNTCLSSTPDVKNLMSQNQFCKAVESVSSCLTAGKDDCEYDGIHDIACTTGKMAAILNAIASVPTPCQDSVQPCVSGDAAKLWTSQKFCEFFSYSSSSQNTHTCLVTNGQCSESEYGSLKDAMCAAGSAVVVSVFTLLACALAHTLFKP